MKSISNLLFFYMAAGITARAKNWSSYQTTDDAAASPKVFAARFESPHLLFATHPISDQPLRRKLRPEQISEWLHLRRQSFVVPAFTETITIHPQQNFRDVSCARSSRPVLSGK